jgi:HTH-type transcriptional regulator/antitoxin HigA
MIIKNDRFEPNWVSPPGASLRAILAERDIDHREFADRLKISYACFNRIIKGDDPITEDIALALGETLNTSSSFWLSREERYRSDLARQQDGERFLSELPIKDMVHFGWIKRTSSTAELLKECLRFFDISRPSEWNTKYRDVIETAAFRTSPSFDSHAGAVATWLRQGEIESHSENAAQWDGEYFRNQLQKIRSLSRIKRPDDFLPIVKSMCREAGVVLIVLHAPNGCRASGATRFIASEKALILLSFRYQSDDHFWFTFFHEAAHLILHQNRDLFIDGVGESNVDDEAEADEFSADHLIPCQFQPELSQLGNNRRAVIRFARRIGVSRGVVVGQMQHRGFLRRNQLNDLKVFYKRQNKLSNLETS